jgi:hypothetical protein
MLVRAEKQDPTMTTMDWSDRMGRNVGVAALAWD